MALHRKLSGADVHSPYRWVVADETERLAVTTNPDGSTITADNGLRAKLLQIDTNTEYICTAVNPVAFTPVSVEDTSMTAVEVKTAYESNSNTNAYTNAEKAKLSGIETGATADQTGAEIVSAIDTELGSTDWRTGDNFDYTETTDPLITTNPSAVDATWLNKTSGEIFVCTDNTTDENHWIGQMGTVVRPAFIQTPTATDPADGATDIGETPTLTANAFVCVGGTDTHASSSWQLATDSGFTSIVYESLNDASNLESITIPSGILEASTQYYWRVKYTGATHGDSSYSSAVSFTTKNTFAIPIGTAGGEGFGVAPASYDVSSLGLAEMTGTTTLGHDNYGNYIHTATGSIMCHVPKFFYRVGHSNSPQYATYGANALDIVGTDVYATESEANAAGYVMPRAFIDGGVEKDGFFFDKYKCSPADNNKGISVKNGVPISLTTDSNYTNSGSMSGCDGKLYDAVTLSRARGTGFNCVTAFMMGAIAMLSVAHAQAATSDTYCAWYDGNGTTNFPKGCNNNSLGDANDGSVTYTTAGDSGNANKPLTGSGTPFAKTTHNGQNCGICDLNGGMWELVIGVTNYGTAATASTAISNDNIYVLKQSVAIKDLTAGWDGTNDVWGNSTHMGTLYDLVTSPHALGSSTGAVYWGSGSNAVFSADTSGVSRDLCGFVPKNNSASDATGTNQFGNDYLYRQNKQNMAVLCRGHWSSAAGAGLFFRFFGYYRSSSSSGFGFRACAYV